MTCCYQLPQIWGPESGLFGVYLKINRDEKNSFFLDDRFASVTRALGCNEGLPQKKPTLVKKQNKLGGQHKCGISLHWCFSTSYFKHTETLMNTTYQLIPKFKI